MKKLLIAIGLILIVNIANAETTSPAAIGGHGSHSHAYVDNNYSDDVNQFPMGIGLDVKFYEKGRFSAQVEGRGALNGQDAFDSGSVYLVGVIDLTKK